MSESVCPRCGTAVDAARGDSPCPSCGAVRPAAPAPAGTLEAALDEIAAQPGVRMFCTMLSSVVVHVGLLCLLFLAFWGAAGIIQESEAPAAVPSAVQLAADTNGSGYKFPGKVAENHEDGRRDESRPAAAGLIGNSPETELAAALPTTAGLKAGAAEAGPGRATAPGWATLRGPGEGRSSATVPRREQGPSCTSWTGRARWTWWATS